MQFKFNQFFVNHKKDLLPKGVLDSRNSGTSLKPPYL